MVPVPAGMIVNVPLTAVPSERNGAVSVTKVSSSTAEYVVGAVKIAEPENDPFWPSTSSQLPKAYVPPTLAAVKAGAVALWFTNIPEPTFASVPTLKP